MLKLERIMCPIDLSDDSERRIRYVVAITRISDAKLFVIVRKQQTIGKGLWPRFKHSSWPGLTFPSGVVHEPSSIDWESVMLEGSNLETIITREAQSRRADLIFMRSRSRPYAAALLGSTAESVARHAPCPVLVMHADDAQNNQIDFIAMGAHGSGFGIHTLFGSNVDRVLRETGCPLLIAHPIQQSSG